LDVKEHEKLGKIWGGQIFFSSFNTSSRGVCILINKHFPFISEKVERDPGGRFILVKGKVHSDDITLVNIYAPNYDDVNFFQSLFLKLSDVEGDIIIGGDFNLTLDPKMDRSSDKNPAKCRSRKIINSSIKELGLCEIWRFAHPKNREILFFFSCT
jgi:exonuclease III